MRFVALCSAFAFVFASVTAERRRRLKSRAPARRKQKPRKPAAPVDTRPRYKRDDTPAAVAAAPAKPRSRASRAGRSRRMRRSPAQARPRRPRARPRRMSPRARRRGQRRWRSRAARASSRISARSRRARADAFYNRGNAHSAKGEHDQAIADFDEALKLEPRNASALNNRGSARADKGDDRCGDRGFRRGAQAERALCVGLVQSRQRLCGERRDRARARRLRQGAGVQPAQRECLYRARRASILRAARCRRRAPTSRAAARLDRKNAYARAVAGDRGAARQTEGRARGRQGPAGRRHESLAGAAALDVRRRTEAGRRADRGGRSEPGAEGRRIPARPISTAGSIADPEQPRRGREAVRGGREGLSARISRRDRGGSGVEGLP